MKGNTNKPALSLLVKEDKAMTTENKEMLAALKSAVTEVLDKKRRLGQYAVVWENNHPVIIENNDKNLSGRVLREK